MSGDAFLDIFDPIRLEMDVSVKLDEIRRGGESVNVSNGKQLKVAVAILAVARRVQQVVKASHLIQVGVRQNAGSQVYFAVGL